MSENLLNLLIEKNFLTPDMEVTVRYKSKDVSNINCFYTEGIFFVRKISSTMVNDVKRYILDISSIVDGMNKRIYPSSIIGIEGMTVDRFAKTYKINPDGTTVFEGKKRGRKTNAELERL